MFFNACLFQNLGGKMSKIKLDENDWNILFEGRSVKVGNKILIVKPFSIFQIASLKTMLLGMAEAMAEKGIDVNDIDGPESMGQIFEIVASNFPALIEEACSLDREDVPKLPISAGITLVTEIINANIDSQKSMVDALSMLGKLMTR